MNVSARVPQPLQRFWAWWLDELSGMLPGHSDGEDVRDDIWELGWVDDQLALQVGDAVYIIDTGDAEMTAPEGLEVPDQAIVLRLSAELAMVQPVALPLAAEENLRQVLAYQMDRETPFTADRVYFDFRVADRDRAGQLLHAEMAVVPRSTLDPVLDRLRRWGVSLRAAQLRSETNGVAFDLLPAERRAPIRRWPRVVNGALLALALVLAVAAIALPIWSKQQTLRQLEPALADARKGAMEVTELRDEIQQLRDRLDFAVNEKRARVKLLDVIAEITRLLPDDTWLLELEISGNEVQMRGETPNASRLVGLLESSKRLRNARFRSPVTQVGVGKERFHLSVDLQSEDAS